MLQRLSSVAEMKHADRHEKARGEPRAFLFIRSRLSDQHIRRCAGDRFGEGRHWRAVGICGQVGHRIWIGCGRIGDRIRIWLWRVGHAFGFGGVWTVGHDGFGHGVFGRVFGWVVYVVHINHLLRNHATPDVGWSMYVYIQCARFVSNRTYTLSPT